MITRIIYHMRKEMIVEIRLNYIVLRRIASKRPLLFDPKITFFKTFSRNLVVLRQFWSFLRLE